MDRQGIYDTNQTLICLCSHFWGQPVIHKKMIPKLYKIIFHPTWSFVFASGWIEAGEDLPDDLVVSQDGATYSYALTLYRPSSYLPKIGKTIVKVQFMSIRVKIKCYCGWLVALWKQTGTVLVEEWLVVLLPGQQRQVSSGCSVVYKNLTYLESAIEFCHMGLIKCFYLEFSISVDVTYCLKV